MSEGIPYPECKKLCPFTEEEWPCEDCDAYKKSLRTKEREKP